MKREDVNYAVSFLLLISICMTGLTGYIQSAQELRKFMPHRWFAYATLIIAGLHVVLNAKKIWRYICRKLKRKA